MHRELKKLLHKATGASGFVVALFLDVRGFSSFAGMAESSEAAVFLRRLYLSVIDDYFSDAAFFKPTGDGLLIIRTYNDDNLAQVINETVTSSLRLLDNFPALCAADPMINFPIPQKLGIGIARGAATSLVSAGKILDYSGRPLNRAARLMDVARPTGVVFDQSFSSGLLDAAVARRFEKADIYLKGIAEAAPITVFYAPIMTTIEASLLQPIGEARWEDLTYDLTLKDIHGRGPLWDYPLEKRPLDPGTLLVRVHYPDPLPSGRRRKDVTAWLNVPVSYQEEAGKPKARINFDWVEEKLKGIGVRDSWPVRVRINYRVA